MDTNSRPLQGNETAETVKLLINEGIEKSKALETPQVIVIEGSTHLFYHGEHQTVHKRDDASPDMIVISTLDGMVEFIKRDPDHIFHNAESPVTVLVESPTKVTVYSQLTANEKRRVPLAQCRYDAPSVEYRCPMDAEQFAIMLQTRFVHTENIDVLLRLVNSMSETNKVERSDDGVSQRLTVKSGIDEVDKTVFKNPAFLSPLRTFTEVEQPESAFVVRFKDGLKAEISEADGGAWRTEAIRYIGAYIRSSLCEVPTVYVIS